MASHLIIICSSELSCILWKQSLSSISKGFSLPHNVDQHKRSITTVKYIVFHTARHHLTTLKFSKLLNHLILAGKAVPYSVCTSTKVLLSTSKLCEAFTE